MNWRKIDEIVKYAFINVPYYKELLEKIGVNPFLEKIENYFFDIPILTKEEILDNHEKFLSKEFENNEIEPDRTSGSTGKILNVYWEKKDRVRSLLSLWTQRKILHNIYPNSKCCYFHSIAYRTAGDSSKQEVFSPHVMIRDGGNVLSLSKLNLDEKTIGIYYDKILQFEPEWIMCHPSTLNLFINYAEKYEKKVFDKLRFIELTGEYATNSCVEKISNYFKVPISNHYGAKEVNGIAYECKNGHLHCLNNNVYVEIIQDGKNVGFNKKGNVCVTSLNNRCMPFIRYDLGDKAIMRRGEECGCGNTNPYLEICAGRDNEIIEIGNDVKIECVVFFYIIEWINSLINNKILQFQVLRIAAYEFTVILTIKENSLQERIIALFKDKSKEYGFKDIKWNFDFVDEICPMNDTGKLNFFYDLR